MEFIESLTGLTLTELGLTELAAKGIISTVLTFTGIITAVNLILYIIRAFSVYTMAKTAEIKNPYLAFVPIVGTYTFGKLAQKYRKKRRYSPKFGILLLVFDIVLVLLSMILSVLTKNAIYEVFQNAIKAYEQNTAMTNEMFSSVVPVVFTVLLFGAVSLAYMIIHYIALWRIFVSFKYEYATAFTVLSVILSVAEPILLFIIRNEKPNFRPSTRFDPDFQIEKVE